MTRADTVRPGQPTVGAESGPICGARRRVRSQHFVCTRDPHDTGQHVADGVRVVLVTWDGDRLDILGARPVTP